MERDKSQRDPFAPKRADQYTLFSIRGTKKGCKGMKGDFMRGENSGGQPNWGEKGFNGRYEDRSDLSSPSKGKGAEGGTRYGNHGMRN